jgi:hypothetical protein
MPVKFMELSHFSLELPFIDRLFGVLGKIDTCVYGILYTKPFLVLLASVKTEFGFETEMLYGPQTKTARNSAILTVPYIIVAV